jgi:hypothetical protein
MNSRKTGREDGYLGCQLVTVIIILAVAGTVLYGGISLINSEPNAMCGSSILKEGQTCERVSRSSGEAIGTFDADGARRGDNLARDFFGWIIIAIGGAIGFVGFLILYHSIYPRIRPDKP